MRLRDLKRRLHRWLHLRRYRELQREVRVTPHGVYSIRGFNRTRSIFVHVPKTAGISIAEAIYGEQPGHYTARYLQTVYGRRYRRYFTFAFVRNPWDRVYSAYRFLRRGGWHPGEAAWAGDHLSEYSDFRDFVLRGLAREEIASYLHFLPQSHFLIGWDGEIGVEFVGRFEALERDFEVVANRLGAELRLPTRNASPPADYTRAYDSETRSVVGRLYEEDVERFEYGFLPPHGPTSSSDT